MNGHIFLCRYMNGPNFLTPTYIHIFFRLKGYISIKITAYEKVNFLWNQVYEWAIFFFKGQVYDWGWFQNTGSHTKITPDLPPSRDIYPFKPDGMYRPYQLDESV